MGIYCEHSICEVYKTNKEIISKIYERALFLRPTAQISYRPYTEPPFKNMVAALCVDFKEFYPDFSFGDYAYISTCMDGLFEKEMIINIRECHNAEVYFNGERQEVVSGPKGTIDVNVKFKKGKNHLLVKVFAEKENFAAHIFPLIPGLRMGTGDYVYSSWQYIEKEGFRLQLGAELSRRYHCDETAPIEERDIDWVFPVMPQQSNYKIFDFSRFCGKGQIAYAYTCILGMLRVKHKSPLKIFIDGKVVYCAEEGEFIGNYQKTTPLLIKSARLEETWGFEAETVGENSLPFVEGADYPDLQWLWIGPFGRKGDSINYPYAPEINLHFSEPYVSICCGRVYWRFYRDNTYLKQYLHSTFYGQWFYAMMVGHYGMLLASKKLGKREFYDYFMHSLKLLCEHRNYGVLDNKLSGYSSYLAKSDKLDRLDPIGTIGVNIAEYYMMTGDCKAEYILQLLADSMCYRVPRFSDGTFYRIETMWTDDTYMCLPFLARLGVITGEERYFDDILIQVRGFYKRLFMKECDLFSHIYFVKEEKANQIPWGRGNGWVLLALSEVLLLLPGTYHGRVEILDTYRQLARGVLACRDKEIGIWHQVLNNPMSYIETSGSAMFITALARGVQKGWLDRKFKTVIVESWNALTRECIDSEGNVHGVCRGSGCNMDEEYYLNLGTIVNDDHGVGIVLGAGAAVMEMLDES